MKLKMARIILIHGKPIVCMNKQLNLKDRVFVIINDKDEKIAIPFTNIEKIEIDK